MTARAAAPRDRWFDPWRSAVTPGARGIVAEAVAGIEATEKRQRKRKAVDQARFVEMVDAVLSDLMHRELKVPGGSLALSLSKADCLGRSGRYGSPVFSDKLPEVLARLAAPELGWITLVKGRRGVPGMGAGRLTTIGAGERLKDRMGALGVTFSDLGHRPGAEVIVLKREKLDDFWDEGGRIDYTDNDHTRRMREEVRQVNAWLARADLEFCGSDAVDVGDRVLRRVFSRGSFDLGGRLFGGFWQQMTKKDREDILIGGDPVDELDYGQMGLRIAYGLAGAVPPPGDLYVVPGLEAHREGVKKLLNAVLFASAPRIRYPRGVGPLMPPIWRRKGQLVINDVLRHHAALEPVLWTADLGFRVMAVESRILMGVLLRLMKVGVVALPVHDALLLAEREAEVAREVMMEVFAQEVGLVGVVRGRGDAEHTPPIPSPIHCASLACP